MQNTDTNTASQQSELDLKKIVRLLLQNWLLIFTCIVIALTVAYIYIRYSTPIYAARGSVILKEIEESKLKTNQILSELDKFQTQKNIPTEIEVIKSRSVIRETVRKMDMDIGYFVSGDVKQATYYKNPPFKVHFERLDSTFFGVPFKLDFKDGNHFVLSVKGNGVDYEKKHQIGDTISAKHWKFTVAKRNNCNGCIRHSGHSYSFKRRNIDNLINYFQGKLSVNQKKKETAIIQISVQDPIPARARDFVNTLMDVYIQQGIRERKQVASRTIGFIENQLEDIRQKLFSAAKDIEAFKKQHNIASLESETQQTVERAFSYAEKRAEIERRLNSLDSLNKMIESRKDFSASAFSAVSIQDPMLNGLLENLISSKLEKESLLENTTPQNPVIKSLNKKIERLEQEIIENTKAVREGIIDKLQNLNKQIGQHRRELQQIPTTERKYTSIKRNYLINEDIYTFLLEKKAEAGISKASTKPASSVLDYAVKPHQHIKPRENRLYNIAFVIGLAISLGFIFIKDYFDNAIYDLEQLKSLSSIPVLGVIGHKQEGKENILIKTQSKSALAESFRSIRTNLQYMGGATKQKTILITSTVGSEGKTFTAMNIASFLAITGKKTLLLGLDLRRPGLQEEFNISNEDGISNVLAGASYLEDTIISTEIENLDVIPSGPLPPNPSELILKEEMETALDKLKEKYDYIVMDSPPIGLVTDALILMKKADITLYILRQRTSKEEFVESANQLRDREGIKNMAFILNDIKTGKGYGYGYGYGYKYTYGYGYYDEDGGYSKGFFKGLKHTFKKLFRA